MDNEFIVIIKPAMTVLLVAFFFCSFVSAGSVEFGFVDDAGLDRWIAGGPAEVPTGETACIPAKFGQSSPCRTVVISNHSSHAVTLKFATSEEEFFTCINAPFSFFGKGPGPCSAAKCERAY